MNACSRQLAIAIRALCKVALAHGMRPALLRDGTRDELHRELQQRGAIGANFSASKNALRVMLRMSIENEELEDELVRAQKRPAASPEAQATCSKRAAAAGDAESLSSDSANVSRDMHAAASAPMTCSTCCTH